MIFLFFSRSFFVLKQPPPKVLGDTHIDAFHGRISVAAGSKSSRGGDGQPICLKGSPVVVVVAAVVVVVDDDDVVVVVELQWPIVT